MRLCRRLRSLTATSRPLIAAVHPSLTRPLRQAVLRPQQPLEALAAHEPPGSFALAARTLYERAGLVIVSAVFEIEPIGPHIVMERCPLGTLPVAPR